MKKLISLCLLLTHFSTFAEYSEEQCRDIIVEGYALISVKIERDSFSTNEFADFNLSVEEFNQLSSDRQTDIYNRIKPFGLVVSELIMTLNKKIERYTGTFYESFMADEMEAWRSKKDQLRKCNPQIKRDN